MDEAERIRIKTASSSMDTNHKALLYEVMKKNVGLITLISLFIPGGGQIYLSQFLKGILILLLSWLIIPWLYGIYDAHTTASKYNNELYMLIFPEPVAILSTTLVQAQEQK
jgi:TM2 domain-containing membrane protein YozV